MSLSTTGAHALPAPGPMPARRHVSAAPAPAGLAPASPAHAGTAPAHAAPAQAAPAPAAPAHEAVPPPAPVGEWDPVSEAVIDLSAIRENTARLRAQAPGAELCAVVKADGFGHGAEQVARAALSGGATRLGVARLSEGIALRQRGLVAPILSWLNDLPGYAALAASHRIDISVSGLDALRRIGAARAGVSVHLEVETGLHRGGTAPEEWAELVAEAARLESEGALRVEGIWSHLSHAGDGDRLRTAEQDARLGAAIAVATQAGLRPAVTHLASSAGASLIDPERYSMTRVGAGLYGIDELGIGLRPAMTVTAAIVQLKRAPAGAGVSYGHDYVLERPSTLALIPVGYADGLPRLASGRASVGFRGERVPVAGRISMDQIVVDLGDREARVGERVVIFGDGGAGRDGMGAGAPTAAEWAAWSRTLEHEIYCGIGARISRRYVSTFEGE